MKTVFCSLFILFGCNLLYAQRTCGTKENLAVSGYKISSTNNSNNSRDTLPNEVIIIPVVIHVIYKEAVQNISDAQIASQIAVLNKDFRNLNTDRTNIPEPFKQYATDVRIQFCLARVDPKGRPTSGIVRKQTNVSGFSVNDEMKFSASGGDDAWDSKRYLNIWVCRMMGRNLGYATFPGGDAQRDGIVIQYNAFGSMGTVASPFNKGRTATHETGHWLGLKHIWGDQLCGSDDVADTPPQKSYSIGCPSFPQQTDCSANSNGDMFMNFMDFSDDDCMNMFTHGQKRKMRSLFAKNGVRNSFLNSNVCDSNLAEEGPLPIDPVETSLSISVYPNPVVDELKFYVTSGSAAGEMLRLINTAGIVVYEMRLSERQAYRLNIQKFPSGVYFLRIGETKQPIIKKIVKL